MGKGQVFTWDLLFGISIFMATLLVTVQLWEMSYSELRHSEEYYEMNWLANNAADQLVLTPGYPPNWSAEKIANLGLAETKGDGSAESRVLDPDKVLSLIKVFGSNYSFARGRLLGGSQYEVFIEFSCLNTTTLECLQGLPLDYVSESADCIGQRIHVNRYKRITDSYGWFEAETLWGHASSEKCNKGCSNNNMTMVDQAGRASVTVNVRPNTYMMWARVLESDSNTKIMVDGRGYRMYNSTGGELVGNMIWKWLGEQKLGPEVALSFEDTRSGDLLDALLFSTDTFYDPRTENLENYGNPNVKGPCVIGNPNEGADSISAFKTAVVGMPMTLDDRLTGSQPVAEGILGVKVVVWGGIALPPRNKSNETQGSTTTTTLANELLCAGSPTERCISPNQPAIDIERIIFWSDGREDNTLTCGVEKKFTVYWRGKHGGDPNYFGFFIDNSSHFVGACQSINRTGEAIGELYDYRMNCTVNPQPSLGVPDGEHDFIVTGEDYMGFCYPQPENTSQDEEVRAPVDVEGCVNYERIPCTSVTASLKSDCIPGTDTVEKIYVVKARRDRLKCGEDTPVEVYWAGTHGFNDRQVQWRLMLKRGAGYVTVGKCRSNVATAETEKAYYNLSCSINLDEETGCGGPCTTYNGQKLYLYVVAESDGNSYCDDPGSPDVEAVGRTEVTIVCGPQASYSSTSVSSSTSTSTGTSSIFCPEEVVDYNPLDGVFETCGCDSDGQIRNGYLCQESGFTGVCVDVICSIWEPASLNCGEDGCSPSDSTNPISWDCTSDNIHPNGWACDNTFSSFTGYYFTQDGICAYDIYGDPVCAESGIYSFVCQAGDGNFLADDCITCGEGRPCDADLEVGDFHQTGTCQGGLCTAGGPTAPLVNADFSGDGSCEREGCNSDCNGCICDANRDGQADGVCVGESCITTGTPTLDCEETCDTSKTASSAYQLCAGHGGLACITDPSAIEGGTSWRLSYFPNDGICAQPGCVGGTGNYVCLNTGSGEYLDDCGLCGDGNPCDESFKGNFNASYGLCDAGACEPNVAAPTDRVNFNYCIGFWPTKTPVSAKIFTDIANSGILEESTVDDPPVGYSEGGCYSETISGIDPASCSIWDIELTFNDATTEWLFGPPHLPCD